MNKNSEHFKQCLRSYGEIFEVDQGEGLHDNLFVKAWGCHIRVRREPGATEPNYYALFMCVTYYGYGMAAGLEDGKKQAFKDLRELIGAKEDE